ncbi:MAG: hypothetical protein J5758_05770 [Abditibacteriota bacterium]|nr:hypothetical protein [Abditibacteriota bacterium]
MWAALFIFFLVLALSFLQSLQTSSGGRQPRQTGPHRSADTRPLRGAVDLRREDTVNYQRPRVPGDLVKYRADTGSSYELLVLLAAAAPEKKPALRAMAQEMKKQSDLASGIVRRIENADRPLDLIIASRDMDRIEQVPHVISDEFMELSRTLGREEARLKAAYNDAIVAANNKNYPEAYRLLSALGDYKDSPELLENIRPRVLRAGMTVLLGSWYVESADKKSPVEWVVLRQSGSRALLISRFVLECISYHDQSAPTDWENCALRAWLAGPFYNGVFTAAEKKLILNTRVQARQNPDFNIPGGADTADRVFILSDEEAVRYMPRNRDRMCYPTRFAESHGIAVPSGHAGWWLRTPGLGRDTAAFVAPFEGRITSTETTALASFVKGECVLTGQDVAATNIGVRPVVHIQL